MTNRNSSFNYNKNSFHPKSVLHEAIYAKSFNGLMVYSEQQLEELYKTLCLAAKDYGDSAWNLDGDVHLILLEELVEEIEHRAKTNKIMAEEAALRRQFKERLERAATHAVEGREGRGSKKVPEEKLLLEVQLLLVEGADIFTESELLFLRMVLLLWNQNNIDQNVRHVLGENFERLGLLTISEIEQVKYCMKDFREDGVISEKSYLEFLSQANVWSNRQISISESYPFSQGGSLMVDPDWDYGPEDDEEWD